MVQKIKQKKKLIKMLLKNINHEEYVDVLFDKKVVRHNLKRIQSKSHKTGTYDVSKNFFVLF